MNLNFAAPAGLDRTTFPRPGRKIFAAWGGEHFVAGVRKSCGPDAAWATLALKVARFLNYVLFCIFVLFLR